jgi:RNA polymerase sigma factor (sigma-70 family)
MAEDHTFEELLAQSSLGTSRACELREGTSLAHAEAVCEQAEKQQVLPAPAIHTEPAPYTMAAAHTAHAMAAAHTAPAAPAALATDIAAGPPPRHPAQCSLGELWRAYKASGDERLREELILHYSPLVKYVAGRIGVGLPPFVEQADVVASGMVGLVDAIEKFDIKREIKFEMYAMNRIRCEMTDELLAHDRIPPSTRQKDHSVAEEALENRELRRLLARVINTLPEREKTVVTLYYYEGMNFAEIGNVLGVAESHASRLHTKAVLQLRAELGLSRRE